MSHCPNRRRFIQALAVAAPALALPPIALGIAARQEPSDTLSRSALRAGLEVHVPLGPGDVLALDFLGHRGCLSGAPRGRASGASGRRSYPRREGQN